jgi:hypothetical protein
MSSRKSPPIVKKQHYIPRFFVENFSVAENRVFELLHSGRRIYETRPENSMCENYAYEDEELLPLNTLEKHFSSIENELAPVISTILDNLKSQKPIGETKALLFSILPTLLIFYYRSGALLTEFSQGSVDNKIMYLSEKILNHEYLYSLASTLRHSYRFAFIKSDNAFVLSDQFIATAALSIKSNFSNVSNRHIGLNETIVFVPLSSSFYAVFWHGFDDLFFREEDTTLLSEEDLQKVNNVIINNSYTKSVASSKEILEENIDKYDNRMPAQTFWGNDNFAGGALNKKEVFFHDIDKDAFKLFFGPMMHEAPKYFDLGVNDLCACGSGKKFKKCHRPLYERVSSAWSHLRDPRRDTIRGFGRIPGAPAVEMPVASWVNDLRRSR